VPISEKLVLAERRLKDRIHKTKRRESKETRNKAEEDNQIQQITHNFEDAEAIGSIASHFERKWRQKHENKASASQKN
jgi:hypothetical protein